MVQDLLVVKLWPFFHMRCLIYDVATESVVSLMDLVYISSGMDQELIGKKYREAA